MGICFLGFFPHRTADPHSFQEIQPDWLQNPNHDSRNIVFPATGIGGNDKFF